METDEDEIKDPLLERILSEKKINYYLEQIGQILVLSVLF